LEVKYQPIKTQSKVLNLYKSPDPWFWSSGSINPYRGCEHNCKYCDGKAEWYRIKNFDSLIRIKIDSPEKYEKELLRLGFEPQYRSSKETLEAFFTTSKYSTKKEDLVVRFPISLGGGVCDIYQPAEKKYRITRKLLKKNRDFGIPTQILTKSNLVLRDLDLINEINSQNYASVSFSITLYNEAVRKIFEPFSSSTSQRFKALKTIRESVHGGVMLMPILPGIGDCEENLNKIIQKAKEVNAEFILASGLTLKPGRNKQEYLDVIEKNYPSLIPIYHDLYANNNKYGIPDRKCNKSVNVVKIVHKICRKVGILDRVPRYIPPGVHQKNYTVSTILYNLAFYYQWIYERDWHYITPFSKAAGLIETYPKDVGNLSKSELRTQFDLTDDVLPIVIEVIETGKSSDLSEFLDPKSCLLTKD
jgi:DNA repair photolyase